MNTQPQGIKAAVSAAATPPQPSVQPTPERNQPVEAQASVPVEAMRVPADAPSNEGAPAPPLDTLTNVSEVYEQAGVRTPAHGFSALKIADMLGSPHIRDFSPEMKKASILLVLESSGVQLNDVIEDATRRERVLNDYETRQQKAWQEFKTRKQQQNKEIQDEIERLMENCRLRMQANEKEIATEKTRLDEWRAKKREEERRIRNAISPFSPNGLVDTHAAGPEVVADAGAQAPAEAQTAGAPAANAANNAAASKSFRWKR